MADFTETRVDVRGCGVHLRRGGSGEPMLFLHGASGVPGWIPAFQSLSDAFDLHVPDHPSYGLSDEPDWLDDMNDLAMFYLDFSTRWICEASTSSAIPSAAGWPWRSRCETRRG